MPTKSNTKKPELAAYAEKAITPVMREYIAWLEKETGYKVDPVSVQLSSMLRPAFQKSDTNQQRLALQSARAAEREQAKLLRKVERENAAAEKATAGPKAEKPAPKPVRRSAKPATAKAGASR